MQQATNNSTRQHTPYPLASQPTTTYVLPPLAGMDPVQWAIFTHAFGNMVAEWEYDEDICNWQVTACTGVGTHWGSANSFVVTLQPVPFEDGQNHVDVLVTGHIATWC